MYGVADQDWRRSSYLVFTPFDQRLPLVDYWTLEWHGLIVPIPRVRYTNLFISGNDETSNSVMLGSENSDIVVYLRRDIHEAVVYQSDQNSSDQSPNLSFTYMTLLHNAFSTTPEDIDCLSEDWATQVPIILAQIAKGLLAYDQSNRVYKSIGQTAGILIQSEWPNLKKQVEYTGVENNFEDQVIQVGYRVKADTGLSDFGLLMTKEVLDPVESPEWVTMMSKFLRVWDLAGLMRLSEEQGWKFSDARTDIDEEFVEKTFSHPHVENPAKEQRN